MNNELKYDGAIIDKVTPEKQTQVEEVIADDADILENLSDNDVDLKNLETTGTVHNCLMLAVRSEPKKTSDTLRVISVGREVIIDINKSTKEYYNVIIDDINGFCSKDFIKI